MLYNKGNYNNDPKEIKARFTGRCSETGKKIMRGESCIYYPSTKQILHLDSKQAYEFKLWWEDVNILGGNY